MNQMGPMKPWIQKISAANFRRRSLRSGPCYTIRPRDRCRNRHSRRSPSNPSKRCRWLVWGWGECCSSSAPNLAESRGRKMRFRQSSVVAWRLTWHSLTKGRERGLELLLVLKEALLFHYLSYKIKILPSIDIKFSIMRRARVDILRMKFSPALVRILSALLGHIITCVRVQIERKLAIETISGSSRISINCDLKKIHQ